MSLVYVTGISGSGKSAVYNELKKRDYQVYGIDEDKLAGWYNNTTGAVEGYRKPEDRTEEWRRQVTYKIPRQRIESIAKDSKDQTMFLCGVAENDTELWNLFSKVFALTVDDNTLEHRITTRTSNDFGKLPHELAGILKWNKDYVEGYQQLGAVMIDATQPIEKVVDDILLEVKPT